MRVSEGVLFGEYLSCSNPRRGKYLYKAFVVTKVSRFSFCARSVEFNDTTIYKFNKYFHNEDLKVLNRMSAVRAISSFNFNDWSSQPSLDPFYALCFRFAIEGLSDFFEKTLPEYKSYRGDV